MSNEHQISSWSWRSYPKVPKRKTAKLDILGRLLPWMFHKQLEIDDLRRDHRRFHFCYLLAAPLCSEHITFDILCTCSFLFLSVSGHLSASDWICDLSKCDWCTTVMRSLQSLTISFLRFLPTFVVNKQIIGNRGWCCTAVSWGRHFR
jgi:hypothetical protein